MTFRPRLSAPGYSSKYWYSLNPFYHAGYGLPNCTCYAWGRFYEILGRKPVLSLGNAEDWYGKNDGYSRGSTPRLGAVICWRKGRAGYGGDGAGHVAVVEKIYSDGSILISQSGWRSARFWTSVVKILQERICVSGFHLQSRSDRLGDFIRKCQLCTGQIVYAAGEYESADRAIIIPQVEKPQRTYRGWRKPFTATETGGTQSRYSSHRDKKEKGRQRYMDKDTFRMDLCTERKDNLCEIVTCQ